jgi:hypothetical protein
MTQGNGTNPYTQQSIIDGHDKCHSAECRDAVFKLKYN